MWKNMRNEYGWARLRYSELTCDLEQANSTRRMLTIKVQ